MQQKGKAIKCVTLCKYKSINDDLYVVSILGTAHRNGKQEAVEIQLFLTMNKICQNIQICMENKSNEFVHCTLKKLMD